MAVAPIDSLSICPGSRATFISQGQINFGASTAINLAARHGRAEQPRCRVVRQPGRRRLQRWLCRLSWERRARNLVQGNVYAPNGCVAFGGGGTGGFTMTGQLVRHEHRASRCPPARVHFTGPGGGAAAPGRPFARTVDGYDRTASPRRQRSRGVAALELALSLTFLVPLLMGTLDFGYYFYVGTNAEEAARAGVREAVLASGGANCGSPLRIPRRRTDRGSSPARYRHGLQRRRGGLLHERATAQHGQHAGGPSNSHTTVTLTCSTAPVDPTWTIHARSTSGPRPRFPNG